jgi:hypothetical protein
MDLWDIPVVDQHAHNLLKPEAITRYPYAAAFTEGDDAQILNHHARYTFCYRRSLRDIAALLNCEPEEEAILVQRANLGLECLTKLCFNAAKLDTVFLDDGLLPAAILPLEWHRQFVSAHRLLRLEVLAEQLLNPEDDFESTNH